MQSNLEQKRNIDEERHCLINKNDATKKVRIASKFLVKARCKF